MNEIELAFERSRRYAELARGFWRPDSAQSRRSLEYDRLFCHRTSVICPIYEVEYDRNRAVSQGPTLADIAGFYRAFGLELAVSERPDHMALELEFMSVLAYKEALALQNDLREHAEICRDAQKKFLEAHLGRWVGVFTDTLKRESQLEVYHTLGTELKTFIESECRRLAANPTTITALPEEADATEVRCPVTHTQPITADSRNIS
uniref:Cytoplasmic chaperone TorD n=2 Tax=Candidatus Bipolaricaulota TaxID=67810 RepID=H5SMJ4_9BACT|nr:cytoplasmic chaperone TorD [uncultured Acetothermia bacterium]BAL58896.1 cytoplasmic chaperone TorD [Candidatus Acetothermum autotrophicum]